MSLRRQLLLVSLLLLSLPWAGCQFIREMEGALRTGQVQSLQATAEAVASVLSSQQQLLYPSPERRGAPPDNRRSVYAWPTSQQIILDGYDDGWEDVEGIHFESDTGQELAVTVKAQTRQGNLYLLLNVNDPEVVYHNPGLSREPNGDRLVLRLWRQGRRQDYIVATAAPGNVRGRWGNRRERGLDANRIRGNWQDAIGGYSLELEIPLDYTGGRLGFYLINAKFRSGGTKESLGNIEPLDTAAPPWLIYHPLALHQLLTPFNRRGNSIQVVDQHNWVLADLPPSLSESQSDGETFWLLRLIYRSILSQDDLITPPLATIPGKLQGEEIAEALAGNGASLRYRDPYYQTRTLQSAAVPVIDKDGVMAAVVMRQSGENYLSLTDQAFSKLLGYSLASLGIGALGLLGYASLLSWRIRKLSIAASNAIGDDGLVSGGFPRSRAKDEIGELSRHYGDLLQRVREYNDYLRTLSRKLSHELRTPVAVIQTSLDNLEHSPSTQGESDVYLQRARGGLLRLQRILTAMNEASRLEESIRKNQAADIDLVPLIKDVFEAYRGIYQEHRLQLVCQPDHAIASGVPDLIVQALDKLMENAASFCPTGEDISIQLDGDGSHWRLSVINKGPLLPGGNQDSLFEPMVSLRQKQSDDLHLGLGLHIVRLIAEFHGARIIATNQADGSGVELSLLFPRPGPEPELNSQTPTV